MICKLDVVSDDGPVLYGNKTNGKRTVVGLR